MNYEIKQEKKIEQNPKPFDLSHIVEPVLPKRPMSSFFFFMMIVRPTIT